VYREKPSLVVGEKPSLVVRRWSFVVRRWPSRTMHQECGMFKLPACAAIPLSALVLADDQRRTTNDVFFSIMFHL